MIWGLIPDWLFAAIGAGVGGFIMHFVGRWSGKREGRSEANSDALKENINTRKRMDEADIVGDDPDAARRWLHERSKH